MVTQDESKALKDAASIITIIIINYPISLASILSLSSIFQNK